MRLECGLMFLAGACLAAGFLWGMFEYWERHRNK
jgi:hypothetical protein